MKKHKSSDFHAIVVSYVPLLRGVAGDTNLDPTEIGKVVEEAKNRVEGCVWLNMGENLVPCFLMDGAKEVAQHLIEWSEEKPEDWFKLAFTRHGGIYGLALMPNVEKGMERFRMAYQLRNGLPIPKNAKFSVFFKPLCFISLLNSTFCASDKELPDPTTVYMLDKADFNGRDTDFGNLIKLGSFELMKEGPMLEYLIGEMKKELEP